MIYTRSYNNTIYGYVFFTFQKTMIQRNYIFLTNMYNKKKSKNKTLIWNKTKKECKLHLRIQIFDEEFVYFSKNVNLTNQLSHC